MEQKFQLQLIHTSLAAMKATEITVKFQDKILKSAVISILQQALWEPEAKKVCPKGKVHEILEPSE